MAAPETWNRSSGALAEPSLRVLERVVNATGTKLGVRVVTSDYTTTPNDYAILVDATAGAVTITLMDPRKARGQIIAVTKIDDSANAVTVEPFAGTIDGLASLTLTDPDDGGLWAAHSEGASSGWYRLAGKPGSVGEFSINAEGADPSASGTTNRTAIYAAIAKAQAAGGGRITARPGTYQIAGSSTRSLLVPINGPDFSTNAENLAAHFHVIEPTGLHFDMPGVTLESADSGFNFFVFDGPRDVTFSIGSVRTATTESGGAITVNGLNAVAITTSTRDGWGFEMPHLFADHCNVGLYVFGAATSSYRMRGITVGNLHLDTGHYGVALHNNGDDVTIHNLRAETVNRPVFFYGVDNVRAQVETPSLLGGFQALIKAYDRDCTNIDLRYRCVSGNFSPNLAFQSQHAPSVQATPCAIKNVRVWMDDTDSYAIGATSILFGYFQDTTNTSTVSTTIFDNIILGGRLTGSLTSDVLQTPTGLLDTSHLITADGLPPRAIYQDGGFRMYVAGAISRPQTDRVQHLEGIPTTGTTQYGMITDYRGSSAATALIIGQYLKTGTVPASYTAALLHTLRLANPVKGAASTITKAVSLYCEAVTVGATNYAIETESGVLIHDVLEHDGSTLGFFGATPTTQPTTVSDPTGGATVDAEARTAIIAIIDRLQALGLMA